MYSYAELTFDEAFVTTRPIPISIAIESRPCNGWRFIFRQGTGLLSHRGGRGNPVMF